MSEQSTEEEKKDGMPWYIHDKFSKFWYHYNTMMMTAHHDSIVRAKYNLAQRNTSLMRMLVHMKGTHIGSKKTHEQKPSSMSRRSPEAARTRRNKKRRKRKKKNRKLREAARLANQDGVSDTEMLHSQMSKGMHINDTEDEEEEIDLNEDLLVFLEHSHKHRAEWKVHKAMLKSHEGGVFISSVTMQDALSKEHPDVTRSREMKQLYGSASPRIHAMETAIQLSFDRISTLHRPQFWPNIPLHVMF